MNIDLKKEINELKVLLRSVPPLTLTMFVLSVVLMNLFANKGLVALDWIALDAGIVVSWLSFLSMDIIVKRFGVKASISVSVVAILINVFVAAVFWVVSVMPGEWSASYVDGSEAIINGALNSTLAGSWFIIFGSVTAFFIASVVNNVVNDWIGRHLKKDNAAAYYIRSYASTIIGQFVDNLTFALIVSLHFFGWNLRQCFMCALFGACAELLCEVVFSPLGYKIVRNWEKEGVGNEYIKLRKIKNIEALRKKAA
ncbi:MAG: VUT family protein [Firmicutes bacterium]|nr:VUT family protein [Bacillota bacterium]